MRDITIESSDLLLVIDVQNDFCAGGALAVPDGEAVVPVINALMAHFKQVVLTQDWHPAGHSSFASSHEGAAPFSVVNMPYGEQTLWPDHCVQGSTGAQFHPDLNGDRADAIVRKGSNPALDSYSAVLENDHRTPTGLMGYIRERDIQRVFCCGLATDFCVRYSAEDICAQGVETFVIEAACRGIDLGGSMEAATKAFTEAGITVLT
ncbi:MAG: bifunctional nicotinamidase/pyrazinamidase [Granulosicoccaceae bacterium]